MRKSRFLVVTWSLTLLLISSPSSRCEELVESLTDRNESILENEQNEVWRTLKEKLRLRSFSEFMSPGLSENPNSIPTSDGGMLAPSNLFSIIWTDFEIAKDLRIVYWQRGSAFFGSNNQWFQGMDYQLRNPRFALRQMQVFDNPNLSTTWDYYIQPGVTGESWPAGKVFEVGFRTSNFYNFPSSRWGIGMISELTWGYFNKPGTSENFYGWAMFNVSYTLNPTWSLQHWTSWPFKHNRDTPWTDFRWDMTGAPYTQNGVGINASQAVWLGLLVNNYLTETPSLKNTWASLWFMLTVL